MTALVTINDQVLRTDCNGGADGGGLKTDLPHSYGSESLHCKEVIMWRRRSLTAGGAGAKSVLAGPVSAIASALFSWLYLECSYSSST